MHKTGYAPRCPGGHSFISTSNFVIMAEQFIDLTNQIFWKVTPTGWHRITPNNF